MNKKTKIQAFPKEHYCEKYDSLKRFISYFYQIDLVKKLKLNKVLEIGVGNKTVSNYLKQNGIKVETCDFNKDRKPDYVADVRDLPFKDNSYDVIMACEIFEHIPWEDINKALKEFKRVSKRHVLISVPYVSIIFEVILRLPLIDVILKKPFLDIFFRLPLFLKNIKPSREHYWEMGLKGYSIKKIRSTFEKHFKILKEVRPVLQPFHHFFILKKID